MKGEDHEEVEKMLMDLEGPLLEQVGQLKAVAREAAVPLLNQAKELASEGVFLGAATAKLEEMKSRMATKDDSADQSAERKKLVLELEGELVDKVGQLKSPLRETVVPVLNEALKLAQRRPESRQREGGPAQTSLGLWGGAPRQAAKARRCFKIHCRFKTHPAAKTHCTAEIHWAATARHCFQARRAAKAGRTAKRESRSPVGRSPTGRRAAGQQASRRSPPTSTPTSTSSSTRSNSSTLATTTAPSAPARPKRC